jgi:hypothetical protein
MGAYTDLKAKFKKEYKLRGQMLLDDEGKMKTYEGDFQDITDSKKALEIAQLFRKKNYDELLKQFKENPTAPAPTPTKTPDDLDAQESSTMGDKKAAGEKKEKRKTKADAEQRLKDEAEASKKKNNNTPVPSPDEQETKEKIKQGVDAAKLAAEQEKRKKMDEQMKEKQAEEVPAGSKKEDTGSDEGVLDLDKEAGEEYDPDIHAQGSEVQKDEEAEATPIQKEVVNRLDRALTFSFIREFVKSATAVLAATQAPLLQGIAIAGTALPASHIGVVLALLSYAGVNKMFEAEQANDLTGEADGLVELAEKASQAGDKDTAELATKLADLMRQGRVGLLSAMNPDQLLKGGEVSQPSERVSISPDLQGFYNVYTSMNRLEQLEVNMALGKVLGDVIGVDLTKDENFKALSEGFRKSVAQVLITLDGALKDERYGPQWLEQVFRESLETLRTSPNPDIPVWVNQPESDVKKEFREMVDAMQRGTVSARQYRQLVGGKPMAGVSEGQYLESIRLFLKKYPAVAFDPRVKKLWRTNGLRYDAQEGKFMVNRLTVNKDLKYYDVDAVLGEGVPEEVNMDNLQESLTRPTEGQTVPPFDPSAPGMDDMNFGKPPEPTPQKLVPTDEITGEQLDEEGKPVEVPELLQRTGGSTNPFTSIALSQILLDVLRMDKKETQRVSKGLSEMYGKELPMVQQLQQAMTGQGVDETASRRGLYQMMRAVQNYEVKDSVGAIGYLQTKPQANAQLSAGIANVAGKMAGEAVGAGINALGGLMSNSGAPVKPADLDGIDLDLHMTKDGKLTPESIQRLQSATAGAGQDRRLQASAVAIKITEYAVKYIMYQQAQAVQQGLYSGNFINNTKQSIENISSLATYGEEGGKNFMEVLTDTASNLASGNVSAIIDDWGNTFSSVGYALWDTDKAGVLQKLQGGIKARQARLADRQKAVLDHQKRMGTYYTNSGMTSFHRRGIPEHSIQEPPMDKKPFGVLADPRPLPNMTYQALRVLDTRSRGAPSGFKLRT